MAKPRMAKSARRGNKSRRRFLLARADAPVTDWERADDAALCVRMAADYSDEAIHCGYWPVVPVRGNAAAMQGPVHGEQDSSCRNRFGPMKNLLRLRSSGRNFRCRSGIRFYDVF